MSSHNLVSKRFALLGSPVLHSKSPAMHQAAYRALNMPHIYTAIDLKKEDLGAMIQRLRSGEFCGFNVTSPLKQEVLRYADRCSDTAYLSNASNTLMLDLESRVVAHNTDVLAIQSELQDFFFKSNAVFEKEEKIRILILGAGGAARAAITAITLLTCEIPVYEITIAARAFHKFSDLGPRFLDEVYTLLEHKGLGSDPFIHLNTCALFSGDTYDALSRLPPFDLIVQCTSSGMMGKDSGEELPDLLTTLDLSKKPALFELVYAPPITPIMRKASELGLKTLGGLGMLAKQGALSFELWLSVKAPFEVMLGSL